MKPKLKKFLLILALVLISFLASPSRVWAQTCADKEGYCQSPTHCLKGDWGKLDCKKDFVCCKKDSSSGGTGDIFGNIKLPSFFKYGELTGSGGGLVSFLNNILKFLIVIGGFYALLNLILAGYGFMSAGGDPQKVANAWAKIWQTLIGLLFIAGSFVLAAIFGWLLFGDATIILRPKIYGP